MPTYTARHADYYQRNKELIKKKNHHRYLHRTYGIPMDLCEELDGEIMANAKEYKAVLKLMKLHPTVLKFIVAKVHPRLLEH